jgi:putative ABC transport system permease protein
MILFHLKLALISLRSTPRVSLISVLAIALGIGVAISMTSIHYVFAQNPLPEKSDVIFNVRIDTWDPNSEFFAVPPGEPPKAVTYQDMTGMMESDIPKHQTGVGGASVYVFPADEINKPYQTTVQLVHADFFPMFNVPFKYGSGWDDDADRTREAVTVLSQAANDKLFGGRDSVGELIRLGTREFTVIGVLAPYQPTPKFYDVVNSLAGATNEFFVPFDLVREQDLGFGVTGNTDGWGDNATFVGDLIFTTAEWYWIQLWVEVDPARHAEYTAFVDDYSRKLKELGRYPRPLNNRVTLMMDWVSDRNQTGGTTAVIMMLSILFLAVCAINLTGLLLGKFLAKANRIGIYRALGAPRRSVFMQHLIECELVGLLGGTLGILLAMLTLRVIVRMMPNLQGFISTGVFRLDGRMIVVAIALALVAGLCAGIYPAWRASRISPAMQINIA